MGFLSNLCAESIIHIKDPLQRMSAVQYVALIIFNFSSIPLESVLKQSYRARYYLFAAHSSSDDRIKGNNFREFKRIHESRDANITYSRLEILA